VRIFKIAAMVFLNILAGVGFFDLGQEAYTLTLPPEADPSSGGVKTAASLFGL
jgi:hypothetical protein